MGVCAPARPHAGLYATALISMRQSNMKSTRNTERTGWLRLEIFGVDPIELREVARIAQPDLDVDHVGERAAGQAERLLDRADRAANLLGEAALAHVAAVRDHDAVAVVEHVLRPEGVVAERGSDHEVAGAHRARDRKTAGGGPVVDAPGPAHAILLPLPVSRA